jgi:hypothetical protein
MAVRESSAISRDATDQNERQPYCHSERRGREESVFAARIVKPAEEKPAERER